MCTMFDKSHLDGSPTLPQPGGIPSNTTRGTSKKYNATCHTRAVSR